MAEKLKPTHSHLSHTRVTTQSVTAAFSSIVVACLSARVLAESWERTAGRIALSSLNARLAARRSTHDQAVFHALSRETHEISGAIRSLIDEGLPLARGLVRRSIGVIRASRNLEVLEIALLRKVKSRRVGEVTRQLAATVAADKAALAPDLDRLSAILCDLEWQLVRIRTVALYFRIEGSRDHMLSGCFIDTSRVLSSETAALEGVGAVIATTFRSLKDQLVSREASTHHEV